MTNEIGSRECIWYYLSHMRISRIIILVAFILFLVPLITHYYLSSVENGMSVNLHDIHTHLDLSEDYSVLKAQELRSRVEELIRIKSSVSSELRDMEAKRQKLQVELTSYSRHIEQLKLDLLHQQTELNRLKISVEQAQVAQREALIQNTPELALPLRLVADSIPRILQPVVKNVARNCQMYSCFDHSRCSLTSSFPVYLYDPDAYPVMNTGWDVDGFIKTTLKQTLGYNPHLTRNPEEACVYIVLVGEALIDSKGTTNTPLDSNALKRLPYWGGDGRNHVLLNLARRELSSWKGDVFSTIDTGRAILVQSTFTRDGYRPGFDLVVSPILGPPGGDVWQECVHMLPARRKYLLSFQGEITSTFGRTNLTPYFEDDENSVHHKTSPSPDNFEELDLFILQHLREMAKGTTSDQFYFQFVCVPASDDNKIKSIQDWALCGTDSSRKAILKESTFVLILAPGNVNLISSALLQARIYEALRSGAIPVILGGDQVNIFAYIWIIHFESSVSPFFFVDLRKLNVSILVNSTV